MTHFSDLAPSLLLEVDPQTFDSPHTKAHLLFQAHFSRLPLPSTDYLTDTNSVLDQAIRILQVRWSNVNYEHRSDLLRRLDYLKCYLREI